MKHLANVKTFVEKNERHLSLLAFGFGFVWDNLTLTRIDLLYDNLVLTFYIIVAAAGIILHNSFDAGSKNKFLVKIAPYLPYAFQFAFGGLMSGFVVFYMRSASISASWPFLLFLILLFVGNEFFKKKYARLTFQISMFFISVLSYNIFLIPVITKRMGPAIFIASAAISLLMTAIVAQSIKKVAPLRYKVSSKYLKVSLGAIMVAFIASYFFNIIPPLPLSLKKIGVYHMVSKIGENYSVYYEPAPWYQFWREEAKTFTRNSNEPVYVWSSIFAPSDLKINVYHEWFFYDKSKNDWRLSSKIPFTIKGGRNDGYRGYTMKSSLNPGKWKVKVKTANGQTIGERTFRVINAPDTILTLRRETL